MRNRSPVLLAIGLTSLFTTHCSGQVGLAGTPDANVPGTDASITEQVQDAAVGSDAGRPDAGPPLDDGADLFTRMGVRFGPRNGSPCELNPPRIPAFDLPSDGPGVLKVCLDGGCPYQTIQAALDSAIDSGAIVAVNAGDYQECLRMNHDGVILQGRGGRPHVFATDCPAAPFGGAVIGMNATDLRIENLELSEPKINTQIGVSTSKDGLSFELNNLYLHHLQQGLYVTTGGTMRMANIYIDHVGHQPDPGDPFHVSKGLAPRGGLAVIKNSVEVRPNENSEMFIGLAEENDFDCLVTADLDTGTSGYQMAFALGQNTTVTHSVLQKGPLSDQKPFFYWNRTELRPILPADQLTFTNNIFVYDKAMRDRPILDLRIAVPQTIQDNVFIGAGGDQFGDFPRTTIFLSRADAGIATDLTVVPYPGSKL